MSETQDKPGLTGRRLALLGGCASLAIVVFGASRLSLFSKPVTGPRAKLEVTRVDDTIDAFANVTDESLPAGEGIAIFEEMVPSGGARSINRHFARIATREGEQKETARARFRAWLETIPLPPGARFGLEEVVEYSRESTTDTPIGLRTYVLVGESVLQTADVTDASAMDADKAGGGQVFIVVTLSPDAGKRFEDATRAWTRRRLAIIVDDEINSAPVVQSVISGGRISITMGSGDPAKALKDAKLLARRLSGR